MYICIYIHKYIYIVLLSHTSRSEGDVTWYMYYRGGRDIYTAQGDVMYILYTQVLLAHTSRSEGDVTRLLRLLESAACRLQVI